VLEELRLAGLGVIEDAVLELAPGFTVVTGETGAGKTMVVTALNLLLGGRGDVGLVRAGAARALVEGRVQPPAGGAVLARAVEAGAELDDGALLLSRTVSAEGRSRAHAGGRSVPLSLLQDLADDLVAVHGQSDQQRLLQPARQRAALDSFAGDDVAIPLRRYTDGYARLRVVLATLDEIRTRARERAQEADLLRHGIGEVDAVGPVSGEEVELDAEIGRLAHSDTLRRAAEGARGALTAAEVGDSDALSLVATARSALGAASGHDRTLDDLADRLAEAGYLLADVAADLASYASSVDDDPARLDSVQERRSQLSALMRKYGEDTAAVLAWVAKARERLADLEGNDERLQSLEAERDDLLERLAADAAAVSDARRRAAERFESAVSEELAALAMPNARITVEVRQHDDPQGLLVAGRRVAFGPAGVDEVELLLSAHSGAPARPLQRGASGGELSRVMLAVEVVFAGADPVPTFVFDEVDAGVGGKAAVEIGRRLATLARTAQVVVVTHLPQVAAFADRHLVVTKTDDGSVTRSGVRTVDGEDRLRELSRMLAGLEDSALARGHAEELLAAAVAAKQTG
jgi:DNA repair protein RecN (Recombination protein N)